MQCCINKLSCFFSSSHLPLTLQRGLVVTILKLSHAQAGGCSDGSWTIYSAHRLGYLDHVPLSQCTFLLAGSMHRVIDARAGNGYPVSCPDDALVSPSGISCYCLFPLQNPFAWFTVPSMFTSTGWCLRTLTL